MGEQPVTVAAACPGCRPAPAIGVLLTVLALAAAAQAQGSATIAGTIRDATGGVLAGAQIQVLDEATGVSRETTSGARGEFEVAGLSSSEVVVVVSRDGFQPARRLVAALTPGERRLVDVRLGPASVTESVAVSADPPLGRVTSPALGGAVTREQIERVPVNGRDLIALAYLIPGAAPARGFYNLAPRLTINGASSLVTNYSIDGFDNTDLFLGGPKVPVTVGATETLRVLVNAYSTEYGRTGNGVFSVTTRSGTNTHRGDAFYVVRPGASVDSPNFFAPRDASGAVIDDSFRRHQGGGAVGGPLRRDRLFYFANTEVTRERQDAILTSPLAVGLAPTSFRNYEGMARVDAYWSGSQNSTIRYLGSDYTHDRDVGFIGGLTLPSAGLQVNYRNHYAAFTHRSIGPRGVNELGVQAGQLRSDWRPLDAGPRIVVTDRGATLAVIGAVSDNFRWTETDLQVRDVYTWLAGRHTIKVGGDVLRGDFTIDSGPGARGAYTVDLEGRPVRPGGPFLTAGDLPREVRVLSYSHTFVNPVVRDAQVLASAFAEDVVRLSPDVTITAGLRWDYDSITSTPVGDGDWNNVAPRVGVSWTPGGSARHQLRGGAGMFYERIPFAVHSDTVFNNPDGGAVSVTFAPGTAFPPPAFPDPLPRSALSGVPLDQLPPRNVQVFDPDLKSPWTAQASAGYVWTPASDLALTADYVYSRGRNLIRRVDTNAPASLPTGGVVRSVAAADLTRPVIPMAGGFRLIERDESSGRSTFHGLYLNARKHLRRGFAVDVAYTLSRIEHDTDDINFRPDSSASSASARRRSKRGPRSSTSSTAPTLPGSSTSARAASGRTKRGRSPSSRRQPAPPASSSSARASASSPRMTQRIRAD